MSASLLLGVFWAAWHLPALFYRDTHLEMRLLVVPMLITVAVVGSVVYTWLYIWYTWQPADARPIPWLV